MEKSQDMGVSPDGAGPAGCALSPSVSAVPALAPDAWPTVEYEGGYPVDEDFADFADIPMSLQQAARWLLVALPQAAENMICSCAIRRGETITGRPCYLIYFSTGGWSGAESLIDLILSRFDTRYYQLSWRRGGHYVFEIPDALLAQGIEAAEADETRSGSAEGESPVPQGGMRPNSLKTSTISEEESRG